MIVGMSFRIGWPSSPQDQSLELHAAHGYLLHQFLSPLAKQRTDEYGCNLENRMRFPLGVFDAVRQAFRSDRPVWIRLSATPWVSGGWAWRRR